MGLLTARGRGAEQRTTRRHQAAPGVRDLGRRCVRLQLHPHPPPANERPPDDASLLKYRWSSIAASSGLASSCISSRASTSRCQGLTPIELQPLASAAPPINISRLIFGNTMEFPLECSLFCQYPAKLILIGRAIHRPKPDMRVAHRTVPIDDHTRRHAFDLEVLSHIARGIKAHVKAWMKQLQEFLGIGALRVDIDEIGRASCR